MSDKKENSCELTLSEWEDYLNTSTDYSKYRIKKKARITKVSELKFLRFFEDEDNSSNEVD